MKGDILKNALRVIALISGTVLGLPYANAACDVQSVTLFSGKTQLEQWDVVPGEIRPITLPNGFKLGLQFDPASEEKNRDFSERMGHHPPLELLKISLYDLTDRQTKLLTHTFGDTNSIQGYSPRGGADGFMEGGEHGILLDLKKPKCSDANT